MPYFQKSQTLKSLTAASRVDAVRVWARGWLSADVVRGRPDPRRRRARCPMPEARSGGPIATQVEYHSNGAGPRFPGQSTESARTESSAAPPPCPSPGRKHYTRYAPLSLRNLDPRDANMAGARSLGRATECRTADFAEAIIAVANSFTQFVPPPVQSQGPRPARRPKRDRPRRRRRQGVQHHRRR